MQQFTFAPGDTSKTIDIFLPDSSSTTGAGLTGLVYNTASLAAYYRNTATGTVTAISLATQTVGGAWSSGGFVELDATHAAGMYRLDIPNAVLAAVGNGFIYLYGATNLAPTPVQIVVGYPAVNIQQIKGTTSAGTAGYAGIDWSAINAPTTSVALTGTTIATTQQVDVNTIKTQAVTCSAGVTVGAYVGNATAALSVSAAGGVTLADGVTHGGTTAMMRLGTSSSTPAFYVTSSSTGAPMKLHVTAGSGAHALQLQAFGAGSGINSTGGATGSGMTLASGGTSGRGLYIFAASSNGDGVTIEGAGTGAGVRCVGGETNGSAVLLASIGTGSDILLNGSGTIVNGVTGGAIGNVNVYTVTAGAITDASFAAPTADPSGLPSTYLTMVQWVAQRLGLNEVEKTGSTSGTIVVKRADGSTARTTNNFVVSGSTETVEAAS